MLKQLLTLNLANKLTFARILAVPVVVVLLEFPGRATCLAAMLLLIAASLTDMVDGMVARYYDQVTTFGKFLDPLADKILVGSALIMITANGWIPAWIVVIILAREITVTGLRAVASEQGVVIAADKYGKMKTVLQILAICPLALHFSWWGFDPNSVGMVFLYLALLLTVFSGGNYLYTFYKNWLYEK
ncbi:MAG: CDP-diacylglycerol--glycerol-3-phosphate 3-phosphatidyltransferase [Proteobacteria bacterium]|nr:CDP-diacylglycerol--glycerol-3-phosphate 3-phosphatidyltransferase [Pseudomonadota bacterium]